MIGYSDVRSVKLGIKGWNDADQDLVDEAGNLLDGDDAEALLSPLLRDDQKAPSGL